MSGHHLTREDAEALIAKQAERQRREATTPIVMDENVKPETDEQHKERMQQVLIDAQDQFRIDQKIMNNLMTPYAALKDKLRNFPKKERHNDPQLAQMYREINTMRREYFARRRLPKGHPERIDGAIPEMEQ